MNPGRCYKRIEIHGWRSWDLPIRDIESCLKKTSSISTASKIWSNWIAPRIPKFVQQGFKKLFDSLRQDSAHLAKGIRCKPTLPSCWPTLAVAAWKVWTMHLNKPRPPLRARSQRLRKSQKARYVMDSVPLPSRREMAEIVQQ
jgi:hypothetical protein